MSNERIECSCGKCTCIDWEEHEKNKYSVLDYNCSSSMVRIFANANINIVDARNTIAGIYKPLDIENYLNHTVKKNNIKNYPAK